MAELKRSVMIKAAKELNEVLGLTPPIKTGKDVSDEELKKQLLEGIEQILPSDEFSEGTWEVIHALKGEKGENAKEMKPEEPEEEEETEEVEAEEEKEKEGPEEVVEEKPQTKSKPAPAPKKGAQKPANPSEFRKADMEETRIGVAALVVKNAKKPLTIDEWIKKADEMYVKKGGSSNPKESRYAVNVAIKALVAYGVIDLDGNQVTKA